MDKTESRRVFLKQACLGAGAAVVLPSSAWAGGRNHSAPGATAYAYDERFPSYYQNSSELPERVIWIHRRVTEQNLIDNLVPCTPHGDPMKYVGMIHTPNHIRSIEAIDVYTQSGATEKIGSIAELAAGYVLGAVRDVFEGRAVNAFCNIRPPGHHVTNGGYPTGFCVYANVVVAARFAREEYGIRRILILDHDYHHGNGTVALTCGDRDILFFETGGWGGYEDCNSEGTHVHIVPFSGETGNDAYVKTWHDHLIPAVREFRPELVLISAGFDLKKNDALGAWNVTSRGVSKITRIAIDIAEEFCDGRLVSMLEGGYADRESGWENRTFHGLADCAEAQIRTLLTGEIQPEGGYFAGTRAQKHTRPPGKIRAPWIKDGRLWLPQDTEGAQLSMRTMDGRQAGVPLVIAHAGRGESIGLPRLPAGSYVVSVRSSQGHWSLPVVITGRE